MLKAFLDRYGSNGLAGTVAVPVMTGGWPGHLLAVEVHLRPVLVELGATVPARGLYVTEPEFANLDTAVAKWADTAVPLIRRALSLTRLLPGRLNAAASWEARRCSTAGREVLVGQCDVAAAEEHQRAIGVGAGFRVPDAADDDLVIAAGQRVLDVSVGMENLQSTELATAPPGSPGGGSQVRLRSN